MDQSNPKNYLSNEQKYFSAIEEYFISSDGSYTEKMHAFPRFTSRQAISYFMARNEIYKNVLDVHGSIFDFGIYRGSSFFTWQQLSAIYEPYNHIRKIIGFESFEGFSVLGSFDIGINDQNLSLKRQGGMAYDGFDELSKGIELFDMNRPLGHVNKGSIIKGELPDTCINYLENHQESIIALANFGLGLYEPTLKILKSIKPRLIKGSVLVFEDLNQSTWPGESQALREVFPSGEISLNRIPWCPHISWTKIGN
jgi:hypothetical protein